MELGERFELSTYCLQNSCSNQLSYPSSIETIPSAKGCDYKRTACPAYPGLNPGEVGSYPSSIETRIVCRERDSNPRSLTAPDLQSGTFDRSVISAQPIKYRAKLRLAILLSVAILSAKLLNQRTFRVYRNPRVIATFKLAEG